jgi:hypothetical protein
MSRPGFTAISLAGFAIAATGCGKERGTARDPRSTAAPSVAVMAPDTMMHRIDSTNAARKADSLARAKLPARKTAPDPRLRDSAFGPKLELDSMGKVRLIKRPKKPGF